MKIITPEEAIRFLEMDVFLYLAELTAVAENIPNVPRQIFGDGSPPGVVMIVETFPHGTAIAVCGKPDDERSCDLIETMRSHFEHFTLMCSESDLLHHPIAARYFSVGELTCYRSLVCADMGTVPIVATEILKLEPQHESLLCEYPQERETHRPSLLQLYQLLVLEAGGEIYVSLTGGAVQAYLACMPSFRDIWDVDFIHVTSANRGRGLGRDLAAYYARTMLSSGRIAYYSSPRNEASTRSALRAGFQFCRTQYSSELSLRSSL